MHNVSKLAGLFAAAAILVGGSSLQAESAAPIGAECTVTAIGDLKVGGGEQELKITASEAIGDGATASFPEDAKIKVNSITAGVDGSMTLKVDASEATAGTYELTLRAGATECTGDVKVKADGEDAR